MGLLWSCFQLNRRNALREQNNRVFMRQRSRAMCDRNGSPRIISDYLIGQEFYISFRENFNNCPQCGQLPRTWDTVRLRCGHFLHLKCLLDLSLQGEPHCPQCNMRCPICLAAIEMEYVRFRCLHRFHTECSIQLYRNYGNMCLCPLCRRPIVGIYQE